MDFSNSVILPREDFEELQTAAWDQNPVATSERLASIAQTTILCVVLAGAVTAGSWGWAQAVNWRSEKVLERARKAHAEGIYPLQ